VKLSELIETAKSAFLEYGDMEVAVFDGQCDQSFPAFSCECYLTEKIVEKAELGERYFGIV
jgi:hypothetical protein